MINYKVKFDKYLKNHGLFLEKELYTAVLMTLNAMLEKHFLKDEAIKKNSIKYGVTQRQVKFYIDQLKIESNRSKENKENRKSQWSESFYNMTIYTNKLKEDDAV